MESSPEGAALEDRSSNSWKVINDLNKHTLRVTSYEDGNNVPDGIEKLPLDVEIFQNLVDNICRKFDPAAGENLLCFGGCAVFAMDGSLERVESFLPGPSPALLGSWLHVSPRLHSGLAGRTAPGGMLASHAQVRRALWEALLAGGGEGREEGIRMERSVPGRTDHEFYFRVSVPERRGGGPGPPCRSSREEEEEVEDPTAGLGPHAAPEPRARGGRRKARYKLKGGLPLPPRPVLSLSQEEVQSWFPNFVERLGGKRFPTSMPRKMEAWDQDVDSVLTSKDFAESGPRVSLDWSRVSSTFYWKLKLAAAIILEKRGVDYTTFAEEVEEKHEKYSINDLKLMSMSKNPETFEKLFVKNGLKGGRKKPNYLDEFERKSSEIVLQNLRLINARDKRINGNSLPRAAGKRPVKEKEAPPPPPPLYHQRIPDHYHEPQRPPAAPPPEPTNKQPGAAVKVEGDTAEQDEAPAEGVRVMQHKMPALKPIEEDYVSKPANEECPPFSQQLPQHKRKKSSESKEAKPLSQKYLCKNNFHKGDFLIHPSQLRDYYGPVKLVTFRRETKKVFLSVSEFETVSVDEDEVILEKSSHKNRSTPAKFLDSYLRVNDYIEILDKRPDKMRIRRRIPKNDIISNPVDDPGPPDPSNHGAKLEITEADEDTEDSKESFEDDSEMVIDET
jgi:hypothetical protein